MGRGIAGVNGHLSDLSYWHATTKTCAYFRGFGVFRIFFPEKKVTLPCSNHIFKIQWEIHFLKRYFLRQNAPKKNLEQKSYRTLCLKCFQKQFWTSGSAPTRKRMKVKVQIFQFGHFPRSKIVSESSFYTKSYIITILNFFLERFVLKNGT